MGCFFEIADFRKLREAGILTEELWLELEEDLVTYGDLLAYSIELFMDEDINYVITCYQAFPYYFEGVNFVKLNKDIWLP